MTATPSSIPGGVTTAARIPRRGHQRRHQSQRQPRPRADRLRRAGARRRRFSPPTRRRRRRSSSRASTWQRSGGDGTRHHRQQRLRQCVYRRRAACACARRWPTDTARLVGCPVEQVLVASTGVIGVALPIDKIRSGICRRRSARSGADQGPAAARAIMTTDLFPKESAATHQHRRPRGRHRRHVQRLRHDRADDGDDARFRDDRRGGAHGAAGPRAARGGRTDASTRSPSTATARPTIA